MHDSHLTTSPLCRLCPQGKQSLVQLHVAAAYVALGAPTRRSDSLCMVNHVILSYILSARAGAASDISSAACQPVHLQSASAMYGESHYQRFTGKWAV